MLKASKSNTEAGVSQVATKVADLEARVASAQSVMLLEQAKVGEASAAYDAAVCLGVDQALAANRERGDVQVRLDVARRSLELLTEQLLSARTELQAAEAESLRHKAERLRDEYERTARKRYVALCLAGRAILRSWATAQIAIDEANAVRSSGPKLPDAESFRSVHAPARAEVSRERVTRWLHPYLHGQPLNDELSACVKRDASGRAFLPDLGIYLTQQVEFDRVIYTVPGTSVYVRPLVGTLDIPALIGTERPGWDPSWSDIPCRVLALVDALAQPASDAVQKPSTEVVYERVSAPVYSEQKPRVVSRGLHFGPAV